MVFIADAANLRFHSVRSELTMVRRHVDEFAAGEALERAAFIDVDVRGSVQMTA